MTKKIGFAASLIIFTTVIAPHPSVAANQPLWVEGESETPQVELNLPSFAPIIEKLGQAVVNISIEGQESMAQRLPGMRDPRGGSGNGKDAPNSPFDFFFQLPPELQGKRSFSSLGSGFVIHPDGYIVTNNHVIDKATKIFVTFKDDKKTYDAKVIGADSKTDLALLKVDAGHPLSAAVLGNSDNLRPGDWVIAIGNPFRLGHTATVGIVSAKSRKVPGGGPYDDFIQTDASINPGNSGGPLFNAKGQVVGINTAIFSPGRMGAVGFNIGIGFATPINIVKDIISQLHDGGKVVRGWLGVLIQPVSADVAEALKLTSEGGALVADVLNESPAFKAGIRRGDVITRFDAKPVKENDDLPLMVARTPIGKQVDIDIVRQGKEKSIPVKIEELKEEKESEPEVVEVAEESKLGLSVQDITPDIAKSLGLEESSGILVSNVVAESAAEKAGLKRGDIVLEVDSKAVTTTKEFKELTKDVQKNKPLLLLVKRDENTIFLTLKLE